MESKQMTLRSQTVQCPHCGEYYSVTYKYCPFCDAGQKAEEKKKAARKQHTASLLGGLFGGKDEAEADQPARESAHHTRGHHAEHSGEARHRAAQTATPIPRSEGFRKKKMSEMSEEEKLAYRAEREARAAARKRERDRAARASALVDLSLPAESDPGSGDSETPITSPSGMETVELTIDSANLDPATLAAAAEAAEQAAQAAPAAQQSDSAAWESLQDLQLGDAGDQMDAAPIELQEPAAGEGTQAVEVEVPTPVPEVTERPLDPAVILQGDSELDALLSEIRGLLDDAPTAEASPEKAAVTAPDAESAEATVEIPSAPPAPETPAAEAAPENAAGSVEPSPAANQAESAAATEAELAAAVPSAGQKDSARRASSSQTRRKKKRSSFPLAPVIAAVIVVALAALLVNKVIAPAIQDSTQAGDPEQVEILNNAEGILMDKTEVTLTAPGALDQLTPIFLPEGTNAEIKWTCSNWSAVDVDPNGLLRAKAPGVAVVSGTMPNGIGADCTVICDWNPADFPEEATDEAAAAVPVVTALSATEMTLDAQGATQQLALNGATAPVTWQSDKPSVVTVSADGTVTAVSKGSASITAESNGSKYKCEVRCVW